ncbi:MAG TPA: cysteine hydrolase [Acidimicrobiales bacterium]
MTTALLTLHMQNGVVGGYGAAGLRAAEQLRRASVAARDHGLPVIHVRMAFRSGLADVVEANRSNPFLAGFVDGTPTAAVDDALASAPTDLDVVAKRASAFKGSDLMTLLSSLGVSDLVLAGIGTSGVVVATVIEAADLDFGVTVLEDGCTDPDEQVHRVLLDKVIAVRANVCTVDDWITTLH